MWTLLFPKIKPALVVEYRRVCNKNNLRYVRHLSSLACFVFSFHLIHHFRLGSLALSAEMMPYTLLYAFGLIYPGINLVFLSKVREIPVLSPIANFLELAFSFFMASIALVLAVLGVHHEQGITPFTTILMLLCFLMQGQYRLLIWVVVLSWLTLSVSLAMSLPWDVVSPHIAIGFTGCLACLFVANLSERMRIHQFEKISELQISNRQFQLLSNQDHLTGLINRRSFDRALERETARSERFGHPLSLLMIDIDNFKGVNDTYGHVFGDDTIKQVAQCIRKHVRDVDYVGRLGGDEFIVLLVETDKKFAFQVADRMRREVSENGDEEKQSLTVSIGLAQWQGESLARFIERADKALYEAKKTGKNKVRSYELHVKEP